MTPVGVFFICQNEDKCHFVNSTNMANIRRKIEKNPAEPEYLFTEVGVGYRMAESEN